MGETPGPLPARPVRVFLLSRVRLYRDAIGRLLDRHPGVEVVGIADPSGAIALALTEAAPDVVLLELGTPRALVLAQQLVRAEPPRRVLGFGVDEVESDVVACAEAGLSGYVPSGASIAELVKATHRVARGEAVCSATMAGGLFRHVGQMARGDPPAATGATLTLRQRQIARLLDDGLSNKQIARRLCLGTSTVKNHVHNILDRLQVSRRAEAAARIRGTSYGAGS